MVRRQALEPVPVGIHCRTTSRGSIDAATVVDMLKTLEDGESLELVARHIREAIGAILVGE
jgi:uncharacterized protein (DUF2249 family)